MTGSNSTPSDRIRIEKSLLLKRGLLSFGYRAQFDLALQMPKYSLCLVADQIIKQLIPTEALRGENLFDAKGRDPGDLITSDTLAEKKPLGDEMLFLAGKRYLDSRSDESEKFSLSLLSKFNSFEGRDHIVFSTIQRREGLPAGLALERIPRAIPLSLSDLRFGIELFKSRNIAFLGLSPAVVGTLLIEANENQFALRVHASSLKSRHDFPLPSKLFEGLSKIIADVFGLDLFIEYSNALALA